MQSIRKSDELELAILDFAINLVKKEEHSESELEILPEVLKIAISLNKCTLRP